MVLFMGYFAKTYIDGVRATLKASTSSWQKSGQRPATVLPVFVCAVAMLMPS